jgi:hypothetical protein
VEMVRRGLFPLQTMNFGIIRRLHGTAVKRI